MAERRRGKGEGSITKDVKTIKGKKYVYWRGRIVTDVIDRKTGEPIRLSASGRTKKEVVEKLKKIEYDMMDGSLPTKESKITLNKWFEEWTNKYLVNTKKSTRENYEQKIRLYLSPELGKVKLKDLSTHMIQSMISEYANPTLRSTPDLSPKTIKDIVSVLRTCLDQAVSLGLISRNPVNGTKLPPVNKHNRAIRPFNEEELQLYLEAICGHKHEMLYKFALYTGMRESEILGLTWDKIDWEHRKILVDQQMAKKKDENGRPVLNDTKTYKSRYITIGPAAIQCLRDQEKEVERKKMIAGPSCWLPYDLVFPNDTGDKLSYRTVYDCHKRIVRKIGCPENRFHDLRHTYATACIRSGVDIKTLQENLGHSDVQTTLNIYSHVFDSMKEACADQVEAYYKSLENENENEKIWPKNWPKNEIVDIGRNFSEQKLAEKKKNA